MVVFCSLNTAAPCNHLSINVYLFSQHAAYIFLKWLSKISKIYEIKQGGQIKFPESGEPTKNRAFIRKLLWKTDATD